MRRIELRQAPHPRADGSYTVTRATFDTIAQEHFFKAQTDRVGWAMYPCALVTSRSPRTLAAAER